MQIFSTVGKPQCCFVGHVWSFHASLERGDEENECVFWMSPVSKSYFWDRQEKNARSNLPTLFAPARRCKLCTAKHPTITSVRGDSFSWLWSEWMRHVLEADWLADIPKVISCTRKIFQCQSSHWKRLLIPKCLIMRKTLPQNSISINLLQSTTESEIGQFALAS